MHAYLRVVAGPDAGRNIELSEGGRLTIGRGEKSDTHLRDLGVERLHCEVTWDAGKIHVVDLDSVSGTLVDGQKITECELKHGQEFQIGGTRIKLLASGMSEAQTMTQPQKPARQLKPDEAVLTGKAISHYELGQLLTKDCTGTIYKARDNRDGKEVALKALFADFASNEADVKRFVSAFSAARELHHPNLVALYSAGKQGSTCWFAMEYVEGELLSKVIERIAAAKKVTWRFATGVGIQIARALECAHAKQFSHGNVLPECIMIRTQDKAAKLGGMMLAKVFEGIQTYQADSPGAGASNLGYIAPERTRGEVEPNPRADIYGLGASLYAILAGRPPFQGPTVAETINQIHHVDPIPPRKFQDSIPEKLQDAVMTMLAKRPDLRFQSPGQAARALEQVAKSQGMAV
jgi:serine/threonine-protein kinase